MSYWSTPVKFVGFCMTSGSGWFTKLCQLHGVRLFTINYHLPAIVYRAEHKRTVHAITDHLKGKNFAQADNIFC